MLRKRANQHDVLLCSGNEVAKTRHSLYCLLNKGEATSFTIKVKEGLATGTYSAIVTITAESPIPR
ncbi:hypothetical protein [Paenibacillus sp.]|uniref:hypothetical protein n=1 Tax=Paenibacillus sp. TaxID=58172 RepID=UPI0028B093B6|nr:hypothetical protein [Paenibacillus sp.]